MKCVRLLFYCCVVLSLTKLSLCDWDKLVQSNVSKTVENERKLYAFLLEQYNKDIRPAPVDEPVKVKVGLSIVRLHSFDIKNEMFECHAWLRLAWKDVSLRWNPSEHGGVHYLTVAAHKLWTPDIKLYNSVDHVDNVDPDLNALVLFDGSVAYIPRMTLRSHCKINKSSDGKPYNDQVCPLRFGSWVYDGLRVALSHFEGTDGGHVDLSDYIPKSKYEWFIENATAVLNIKKYPCCQQPFPDIIFYMNMHREEYNPFAGYSLDSLINVKVLLSEMFIFNIGAVLLIPMIFLLPFETNAKLILGSAILVCLTLVLVKSPSHSTAKLCELNFVILVIGLTATSVLHTLWHSDRSRKLLPQCLRKHIGFLSKILCICTETKHENGEDDELSEMDDATVEEGSSLQIVTSKSSYHGHTWRTVLAVIDRFLFVVSVVLLAISNASLVF